MRGDRSQTKKQNKTKNEAEKTSPPASSCKGGPTDRFASRAFPLKRCSCCLPRAPAHATQCPASTEEASMPPQKCATPQQPYNTAVRCTSLPVIRKKSNTWKSKTGTYTNDEGTYARPVSALGPPSHHCMRAQHHSRGLMAPSEVYLPNPSPFRFPLWYTCSKYSGTQDETNGSRPPQPAHIAACPPPPSPCAAVPAADQSNQSRGLNPSVSSSITQTRKN